MRTKIEGSGRPPLPEKSDAAALRVLLQRVAQLAAKLSAIAGQVLELERPERPERPEGASHRPPVWTPPALPAPQVSQVSQVSPRQALDDPRRRLTPREREVLDLVADGLSSKEIARRLGIARATARCHVQNVLTKLGVGSRVHAAALTHLTAADEPVCAQPFRDLTRRETEVLRALAAGLGRQEIAARLHVSPHTVRTHVQRLLAKLGVHSVLGALALARRAGLAPAEVPAERPT